MLLLGVIIPSENGTSREEPGFVSAGTYFMLSLYVFSIQECCQKYIPKKVIGVAIMEPRRRELSEEKSLPIDLGRGEPLELHSKEGDWR